MLNTYLANSYKTVICYWLAFPNDKCMVIFFQIKEHLTRTGSHSDYPSLFPTSPTPAFHSSCHQVVTPISCSSSLLELLIARMGSVELPSESKKKRAAPFLTCLVFCLFSEWVSTETNGAALFSLPADYWLLLFPVLSPSPGHHDSLSS